MTNYIAQVFNRASSPGVASRPSFPFAKLSTRVAPRVWFSGQPDYDGLQTSFDSDTDGVMGLVVEVGLKYTNPNFYVYNRGSSIQFNANTGDCLGILWEANHNEVSYSAPYYKIKQTMFAKSGAYFRMYGGAWVRFIRVS